MYTGGNNFENKKTKPRINKEEYENELKERVVALLKDTSYTLRLFDFSWEHFGSTIIIVKRNDSELYKRIIHDRYEVFFEYQNGNSVQKNIENDSWKTDKGWKQIGYYMIDTQEEDRYTTFYKVIAEQTTQWYEAVYQTIKPSLDAFEFSDCWLLFSIGFNEKGDTLKGIIRSGDSYNHAIFSLDELNYGMSKLIGNGYVVRKDKKFIATEKARAFYWKHEMNNEGHITALLRLAPLFQKEEAKSDCELTIYFEKDSRCC